MRRFSLILIPPLVLACLLLVAGTAEGEIAPTPRSQDANHVAHPLDATVSQAHADSVVAALLEEAKESLRRVMRASPTSNQPPEPDTVVKVIAALDSTALIVPGIDWIVGHRVGLRAMTGEYPDALKVASECEGSGWWCAMLTGYVLHLLQEFDASERAFELGLSVMGPEERCRWTEDILLLLRGAFVSAYRGADCAARIELEHRIWWLADPLYLVPYNDRRTEHYARAVAMQLHHEALAVVGETCSATHHPLEILYGWANWSATYLRGAPSGLLGYTFFPRSPAGVEPVGMLLSDWSLTPSTPFERFEPAYGPLYDLTDLQVASFLRGDSIIVLAAADFGLHPLSSSRAIGGGMILARSESDAPRVAFGERSDDRFLFRDVAPAEPHLVGVEILSRDDGATRARLGMRPPARVNDDLHLSDVLFFAWDPDLDQELDAVASRMLGTERVRRDTELGVFWEVYGSEGGDDFDLWVVIAAERPGLLSRLASALGIRRLSTPVAIGWSEQVGGTDTGVMGRAIHLGIGHVPAGEYTVEITVQRSGGTARTASRRIQIVDGNP